MDMHIERKSFVIDPESVTDASPEKPYGGFKAIASDETRDRDLENLYQDEWITPLPDHITIDIDHGMSVATTVGSAHPYFEGNELWIDASFSSIERAQETRALVLEKHIRTVSVAALVDRSQKSGKPRRELLNVGIVAVPANRNAIIFDAKSFEAANRAESIDDAAVKFLLAVKAGTAAGSSDGAMVQAIHDAAGHLGAACIVVEVPVEGGPQDPSGAEDGANKGGGRDEYKTKAAVLDDEVEAEEVEEAEAEPVVGDEPTPEVVASTEQYSTQDILSAILGANKSVNVDGIAVSAEQFKDALQQIISTASVAGEPQGESPAEAPVEKAAAAADEAPAPADETAADAAESEVVSGKRASHTAMSMWAATAVLSD